MWTRLYAAVLGLLAVTGCTPRGQSEPRPSAPPPSTAVAPGPVTSSVVGGAARRIVAIGDLHGALGAARGALRLAGVLDAGDRWVGGDTLVVQLGDEIDRGPDDRAVLELFERLRAEGHASPLLGNHELMNVAGQLGYANAKSSAAFDDVGGRRAAFAPGGPYAKLLAKRKVVEVLEGTVFVHGGVLPEHAPVVPAALNESTARWLLGSGPEPELLRRRDSPVWTRLYSDDPTAEGCATLQRALTALGAKRMVVGHTVQRQGISSACDGRVWCVDVGLVFGGAPQVLELRGDAVRVLR